MARRKPRIKPLGTIWEIPDELWKRIEPILKEFWPGSRPDARSPTGERPSTGYLGVRVASKQRTERKPHKTQG